MCGIAGAISSRRSPNELEQAVRTMTGALARRGPDDEGIETWFSQTPAVVLGQRRLAIIDRSAAGHQPMLSDNGHIGLVFNGCIYNFRPLRSELAAKGHKFRSNCDTEVLLRGYQEWGLDELLPKLHGMFAFAIWDRNKNRIWLVRDRLGVKPLYYSSGNEEFAFASTQAALSTAGFGIGIDPQAVLEFLHYGFVSENRSIRQGIRKVLPGTVVEWHGGVATQRHYWSLPEVDPASTLTFDQAVERTEELLLEAMRLRLYADVPIGALLSGGIDSTLVCWAMAKLNANVRSFTISTPGDSADESAEARQTAQMLGIPHQVVPLPKEDLPDLDTLVDAYGEPFAAPSALGMLQVSKAVKPFATVLLTGDGGDDVFLGYPFHKYFWMAQRLAKALPANANSLWGPVHHHGPGGGLRNRAQHFMDFATGGIGAVTRIQNGLPYLEQRRMLGSKLESLTLPEREIPMSVHAARNLLGDVLKYEQEKRFVGEFMTKVDGGTMYHALEARSPFLDQTLWEFAAKLPYAVRLHGGRTKAILRELVRRRLGPQVAFRKKRGFSVPVERWLVSRWKPALESLEHDSALEADGWIRQGTLKPAIRQALETGFAPLSLWHLVVWNHWQKKNRA